MIIKFEQTGICVADGFAVWNILYWYQDYKHISDMALVEKIALY